MFEPLDLQTPQLAVGLGFVFAIAGAAILAHATWRRRRLQAWAAGESRRFEGTDSRGERPDAPRDVRVEIIAGFAALFLGTAGILYGMIGQEQQNSLLESNTIAKYPQVQEVEPQEWHGNLLEAEVTTADGQHFQVRILFDPDTGEPTVQGDHPELGSQQ
ncbi:hypothetical protein [Enteractinococcus coprophilus]|uniref:Uncharacterized protein n=1 Tax=Enteractinococcus coprophilus TaxID=1027633 RepID=A0A543AFQ4_9MICC|nr:hypothetical protein [Enteractinococcus coprophilus]TQL71411.1 hypothetical protein FB556_1888 [Enteractinococcus coprophilus]